MRCQPSSTETSRAARSLHYRSVFQWAVILGLSVIHLHAFAQDFGEGHKLLTIWAGSLPIILSAPHGGRQPIPGVIVRRGVGIPQFTTERDNNTAELAEALAAQLADRLSAKPFVVIAQFDRKYLDANRNASAAYESAAAKSSYDAYHRALLDAAERVRHGWGGGLLLDIHGQGAQAETIFRGTENGKSVSALRQKFGNDALSGPKSILGQMAVKGYKILPGVAGNEGERRYTGGYTTQTYGSHRGTKIDAIQLEFGTSLRAKANLERTASDLADAIEVFVREYLPIVKSTAPVTPRP